MNPGRYKTKYAVKQLSRQDYKFVFRKNLDPFLIMLEGRHTHQSHVAWLEWISEITLSVISKPEQYVGQTLPSHTMTEELIREIFTDFVQKFASQEDENAI